MPSPSHHHDAYDNCWRIWYALNATHILNTSDLRLMRGFCDTIHYSEVEEKSYSKPMLWIGIYIAVASLFCILLMVADLFHGFRNRKLWFPSKYFTLNAASITLITIAMKLPVDLSSPMPGVIDQFAKAGSMTFMCTMMANLMPSLASMGNRELFANVAVPSNRETEHAFEQIRDTNHDVGNYVLQLQDEMELGTRTLKSISNSANRSIQKASKQLPTNLLKLIEQCTGFFEGVVKFDSDDILPLICGKFPNCWSLPVATLTCVAITLPNIGDDIVDSLFRSVCEGLSYTFLVEESLNNTGELKEIHKSTMALWQGVELNYKWLGYTLQRNAYKDKNMKEILKWFADKAEEIVVEMMNKHNNQEPFDNSRERVIAANSMYRITQTIMVNYPNDIECNRDEEKLFGLLSSMIVDILVACFANLPQVIAMKCHDCAIEKREASVRAAAKLLGRTKKIIEKLHVCEIASLDPEQMAFIDEWRVHLKHSVP